MTTLEQFNEEMGQVFLTLLPEPLRMRNITAHKRHVFDEVFGTGAFDLEKQLTSPEAIIFEGGVPGVPGRRAIGFRANVFKEALKQMLELAKDPAYKIELGDPDYRNALTNIQNKMIKIFADGRAKCKILAIEEHDAKMEKIAESIESSQAIYDLIFPTSNYSKFLKKIKNQIASINLAKTTDRYKNVIEFKDKIEKSIGNSFSIIGWGGAFTTARELFGKIPVVLGPVPLKHVEYVEIARSGKVLKFRATGSVFLARQEGGADAIRIEGKMYKAEFIIMFLLWALFIYGQSKFREMEDIPSILKLNIKDVFEVRKMNDLIMTNTSLEKPSYEFHQTFPFVNRHFIIPNCYIETISIEDKLPLKDVLRYSILLRTYDKPKEVSWVGDEKKALFGISNKTTSAKMCELSLNAGWRILNASGWLLNENEWKIGSAMKEGVLDTYYDVDWSTIATISYLTLMGVVT